MTMINFRTIEEIAEKYGCQVIKNAELKKFTTFKIGGTCPLLVKLNGVDACKELISYVKKNDVNYHIFGKGSNLIVDDNGFNGVVFVMGNDFANAGCDGEIITCDAGISLTALCKLALENNLTGLEFANGIPGTVGGAVYMNAGAYGGEIKDVLTSVTALDNDGNIVTLSVDELDLSYRNSVFMTNGYTILSAVFKLKKGNHDDIKMRMDELMQKRVDKQPLEFASAGSTFKRPEGSFASLLIDECGLKGYAVGDAEVSTKHAGFVINKGNATFADLMQLISDVRDIVKEKTGYVLECEPEIISDKEGFKK